MRTFLLRVAIILTFGYMSIPSAQAFTPDTTPLIYCTTCTTQASFQSWIKLFAPGQPNGVPFDVLVANPNTNVIYDITIEWEYSLPMGGEYVSIISTEMATQDVVDAFAFWYPYFANDEASFHLVAPSGGYGVGSFADSDLASICTDFGATPQWAQMTQETAQPTAEGLLHALEALAGHTPQGVLIYNNGDVATFSLIPGSSSACTYAKGSARDATGQFINDRGMGGDGSSNGSGYVSAQPGDNFDVSVHSYTVSCAYIQYEDGSRGLIGCTIKEN